MDIGAIITWSLENKETIVVGYFAIVGLVTWIVQLTPTLKDDNFVLPIIKFLGKYIAANKTVKDEDRPK